ncbi:MAG TPA: hypothetical protein VLE27_16375 [Thermoanaerobaculia bacterium]|nr:hypothetical protein [Thermoanaerobaculia bacterium]
MWEDPIVEEVRKVREEHAARFDYDLEKIFKDLKERESKSGHKVVSLPPKRIVPAVKG